MSRLDWHNVGGALSVSALVVGIGAAFLIDGMEPAALVGTVPGILYGLACYFIDKGEMK